MNGKIEIMLIKTGAIATNTYVAHRLGNADCVIVDAGDDAELIASEIDRAGLLPKAILLTHGHFDHIGAVADLKAKYSEIKCFMSREDESKITNPRSVTAARLHINIKPFTPDVYVSDGDKFDIADIKFDVLATSGHSVGSVCYVTDDYIFSGDTLFLESYGRTDFYDGDFDAIKKSVRRLLALEGNRTVLPGHDDATDCEHERRYNPLAER